MKTPYQQGRAAAKAWYDSNKTIEVRNPYSIETQYKKYIEFNEGWASIQEVEEDM